MTGAEFRKLWLSGTTCSAWIPSRCGDLRRLLWEDDTFVLVRHLSHASYVDRVSKSKTCVAYTALYRKDAPDSAIRSGYGAVRIWEGGRWTPAKMAEAMAAVAEARLTAAGPTPALSSPQSA